MSLTLGWFLVISFAINFAVSFCRSASRLSGEDAGWDDPNAFIRLSYICFCFSSLCFDSWSYSERSSIYYWIRAFCLLNCAFSSISCHLKSLAAAWSLLICAKNWLADADVSPHQLMPQTSKPRWSWVYTCCRACTKVWNRVRGNKGRFCSSTCFLRYTLTLLHRDVRRGADLF